ncbi:hypothetical protein TVAG_145850 [Trichomonas vaginalis G3]|uniref:SH3b domain-containing protein n=1 Tax=Trichomonas vaginalis (strain ATCC PRA-98 / G3) TaxID=412133 RepID=A2EFV4_TRIV3|nr:bacterial SH3 domain-like protein [Trichomonas vaginalis G3]EAY08505.1 hypothetical protein TVAG_145850 [Trichomonas vaginalis G3]KAI5537710.1 bacterial SH3 domain-like protein [Trichomonas vaginalis G3]|eukprot:XP_001320728.1 hypothetical protein [Trichomonas vaginalis G3]
MLGILFAVASAKRAHRHRRMMVPQTNGAGTGVVFAGGLGANIRSAPSTSASILGVAGDGTQLTVTGHQNDWWQIDRNGQTGFVHADLLHVRGKVDADIGLNIRAGPGTNYGRVGGLGKGAIITIYDVSSNWYKVDQGWVCADFVSLVPGGSGPTPSGPVIKQYDARFNQNIRNWGCAFMSLCWLGGVNYIDGCNANYNLAVSRGWMSAGCYINSWYAIIPLTGAKSCRIGGRYAPVNGNEKEILQCRNPRVESHFVVGNKNGGIEYDPGYEGYVSYNDHVQKIIYAY